MKLKSLNVCLPSMQSSDKYIKHVDSNFSPLTSGSEYKFGPQTDSAGRHSRIGVVVVRGNERHDAVVGAVVGGLHLGEVQIAGLRDEVDRVIREDVVVCVVVLKPAVPHLYNKTRTTLN